MLNVKFYHIKFLIQIDDDVSVKDISCYTVAAINDQEALKKFLLQDTSMNPSSIILENQDLICKKSENTEKLKHVTQLIYDNDISELLASESELEKKIYQQFIRDNLELIIDVLNCLHTESDLFNISQTEIIY